MVAVKPDGTLIIDDKPADVTYLLPAHAATSSPKRPVDHFVSPADPGGVAQSEEMAAPPRAHEILRSRRRGGGWGSIVRINDPKLIERYRASGFKIYEEGELEELIRKSPMKKRETAALGGFFRYRGEPADVKGAGLQITSRLVTRGYIEVAEGKHRITPAGEAEWLRVAPADQP